MIVAGPSQSGKTTFVRRLLKYRNELFDSPLPHVYWFYGVYQPELHQQLREEGIRVEEGLPSSFESVEPYSIIVLDDLMVEIQSSKDTVTTLFTRVAHHRNCFIILITQNLFEKGQGARTRHLNAQYLVLFKNPRDKLQIRILGSQMYPNKKNFLTSVFEAATERPHGYLFIDNHQTTAESMRLRTQILPDEAPMYVYYPRV